MCIGGTALSEIPLRLNRERQIPSLANLRVPELHSKPRVWYKTKQKDDAQCWNTIDGKFNRSQSFWPSTGFIFLPFNHKWSKMIGSSRSLTSHVHAAFLGLHIIKKSAFLSTSIDSTDWRKTMLTTTNQRWKWCLVFFHTNNIWKTEDMTEESYA